MTVSRPSSQSTARPAGELHARTGIGVFPLSDALGDDIYRRAPVTLDTILMALEHGRPMQDPLTANI